MLTDCLFAIAPNQWEISVIRRRFWIIFMAASIMVGKIDQGWVVELPIVLSAIRAGNPFPGTAGTVTGFKGFHFGDTIVINWFHAFIIFKLTASSTVLISYRTRFQEEQTGLSIYQVECRGSQAVQIHILYIPSGCTHTWIDHSLH